MKYLSKPYTRESLAPLFIKGVNPDGYADLRDHMREALDCGELHPYWNGTLINSCRREAAIDALLREDDTESQTYAPAPVAGNGDAASKLRALQALLGGSVDAEQVRAQVAEAVTPMLAKIDDALADAAKSLADTRAEMLAGRPVTITVSLPDGKQIDCGRQHYLFPLVMACAAVRQHAYLVGPAGSFKTSVCSAVAKALSLPYFATSVCEQTSKSDLLGFIVPGTGIYQPTDFRRAYEFGGVFVLDEIDAGNPNVLAVLNAALANGQMGFADGMVQRHPDFILIACGNTYGEGASRLYVGRNEIDAATLDRFAFIEWPYDEGLEAAIAGIAGRPSPAFDLAEGGLLSCADDWFDLVKAHRAAAAKVGARVVISPRATFAGIALAAQGVGMAWLTRMILQRGTKAADWQKITAAL